MAYDFFMGDMQLPVAPSKFTVKIKNQNKSTVLINEGEINILKSPGLSEISFDAVFPQKQYPFAVYPDGFKSADYYLDALEKLKTDKAPFQFICSRVMPDGTPLFDTNILVSLEEYQIDEDAKDGFDVTVSIKLKQYRQYGTKALKINSGSSAAGGKATASTETKRGASSAPKAKTYTVVSGDSLWNIAKKCLGDGSRYTEIQKLNADKIADPNTLTAGQVLTLP